MTDGAVKQWPLWKTLLLFFGIIIVAVPVTLVVQGLVSPSGSSGDSWRELRADGTDGLVITKNGIDLLLYCGEQSPIAAMIRIRGGSFNLRDTVLYRRPEGDEVNLGGWACTPTVESCSTDGVDPSAASLMLHIAALDGSTERLTYTLDGGTTRSVTYDFAGVRDRYQALAERCAGRQ